MTIGVLGGGQLGRMLALAGIPLDLRFRFLDHSASASAAAVGELVCGEFEDRSALARFAEGLEVVTYEFENVPVETASWLAERVGRCHPPPTALAVAQDRLSEKRLFRDLGIETTQFAPVDTQEDLDRAVSRWGLPAVLKTRRMGYDGKGQYLLREEGDLDRAWERLGGRPLLFEDFVSFDRELSLVAVRSRTGELAFYPLAENHHQDGILRVTLAPAPHLRSDLQERAERAVRGLLEAMDYVGVLAIELFERAGHLLANEIAPRVHNSGHWTIEGAQTSQFENHLRAILGMPLGSTAPLANAAMVNLIGTLPEVEPVLAIPGAHLHLYGKAPRPGRKLGHVTFLGDDPETVAERRARLAVR